MLTPFHHMLTYPQIFNKKAHAHDQVGASGPLSMWFIEE
jgi:hypothetical protein